MITTNIQPILGQDALAISLTGISIVFLGLLLISIYIGLLPKILERFTLTRKTAYTNQRHRSQKKTAGIQIGGDTNNEIAAVIGLVIDLEKQKQDLPTVNTRSQHIFGSPKNMVFLPRRRSYV